MKSACIGLVLALSTTVALAGLAGAVPQRGGGRPFQPVMDVPGNTPYDGRFTFVRLRYSSGFGGRSRGGPPWSHDYPRGEVHGSPFLILGRLPIHSWGVGDRTEKLVPRGASATASMPATLAPTRAIAIRSFGSTLPAS